MEERIELDNVLEFVLITVELDVAFFVLVDEVETVVLLVVDSS